MSQMRKLVDKDFSGRDWNVASGMVISGKAGFQIMGDWAKGEFINAKKVPGKDFLCFRFPGTQGIVLVQLRPVRDVQGGDADKAAAQVKLAAGDHGPGASSRRSTSSRARCRRAPTCPTPPSTPAARRRIKDLAEANKNNTLVGSMAHGHAVPASIKNAFYDVITRHFNGQLDDKKAVAALASAAKN